MERTFIMVKPDGVSRGLIGNIVGRFEDKGYSLIEGRLMNINEELAKQHYAEHVDKPFFAELVSFITSGPVFSMVIEGEDVIEISRNMMGKTSPLQAVPGTIRGDFANDLTKNVIHGSDSIESALREINLYFPNL